MLKVQPSDRMTAHRAFRVTTAAITGDRASLLDAGALLLTFVGVGLLWLGRSLAEAGDDALDVWPDDVACCDEYAEATR